MDKLLNEEEITAWEKATGRKWKYTKSQTPTNWNNEVRVNNMEDIEEILYEVL